MGALLLGFLLGMRHALEADHVAAVTALVTRSSSWRHTVRMAAVWGIGHTLALLLFATVVLALETAVPESLSKGFEVVVGVVLVALGLDVLRRLRADRIHLHLHEHAGGVRHFHAHGHEGSVHDAAHHEHTHPRFGRALLVGSLHGLAGSAAVILLSLKTIHSNSRALLYVGVFGLGSILGMVLFSLAITVPLQSRLRLPHWAAQSIEAAVGISSITLGVWIAVHSL